jgi:hypothetical protein
MDFPKKPNLPPAWILTKGWEFGPNETRDPTSDDVVAALHHIRADMLDPFVILDPPFLEGTFPGYCQVFVENLGYCCEIRIHGKNWDDYVHYRLVCPGRETGLWKPESEAPGSQTSYFPTLETVLHVFAAYRKDPFALPEIEGYTWIDVTKEVDACPEVLNREISLSLQRRRKWEQVLTDEATKWFPDCEDILVWRWNAQDPGECHPLAVVRAWEEELDYPSQVAVAADVFLQDLLEKEWVRSGMAPETIPVLVPHADSTGRRAWRINLADSPEPVRLAVGRATLRGEDLPVWDFDWQNLAMPEQSKTCVISTDDGRYFYEPGIAEMMTFAEIMKPEPARPSYFMLLFRNRSHFQAWMHPEGVLTEIRLWRDVRAGRFTHWRAATARNVIPNRNIRGDLLVAEEDLIPWRLAMELALAYRKQPDSVPKLPGVFWRITDQK